MAGIERTATGRWQGDLRSGTGVMSASSGVLRDVPFTYATRFEHSPGTNPEELIAAAQAGCYSMALANYLSQQGHVPEEIETRATITLDSGKLTSMHLETTGRVPGLDDAAFKRLASEAEQRCPVANLLRNGLEISLDARLK
jgi:osmotically inducible protein OsmC